MKYVKIWCQWVNILGVIFLMWGGMNGFSQEIRKVESTIEPVNTSRGEIRIEKTTYEHLPKAVQSAYESRWGKEHKILEIQRIRANQDERYRIFLENGDEIIFDANGNVIREAKAREKVPQSRVKSRLE